MKKRGTFSEIGGWFIGIIVVLVIIFILFFPNKLFAQARDAVFSFGAGLIPGEKIPQYSGEPRVPAELEKFFDNLVSKIRNSGTKGDCLLEVGKMPKINGFEINLDNNKIELQKISQRGMLTPPEKSETIEGFKPCSVKGKSAEVFYSYFKLKTVESQVPYTTGKITIDKDTKIAEFLFKLDNNHMCVLYLDGFFGDGDFTPNCNKRVNVVDDACISNIRDDYFECNK